MSKSKLSLYFIFISFFTFMAIFLTIVHASYNNLTDPVKQVEADKYLEPLSPALDSDIIQEIEKRKDLNESESISVGPDLGNPVEPSTNQPSQSVPVNEDNN